MELIAKDITCERGGRTVFEHLSFATAAGQLLVLKGRNGAGKTSLLRLIAGLAEQAAGDLTLNGGHPELSLAQHCHFVAHQEAIKPALTVAENLAFWSGFYGGGDIVSALGVFDLERLAPFSAALLSAGQKRRLALSRLALVHRPVWLLDEPTVGLDTASTATLGTLMTGHLQTGGLIVATTHIDIGIAPDQVFDFDSREAAA